jgi:hypothetical protein
MDDIFNRRQSILIADVQVNDRLADIFVKDDGTIGAIGERITKRVHKGEAGLHHRRRRGDRACRDSSTPIPMQQ